MAFSPGSYGLSLAAGVLTTLSPCVLPLLPILAASALASHRWGVVALALGLGGAFAFIGTLVAAAGASLGIDPDVLRSVSAGLMIAFGVVMLSARLQAGFARASAGISAAGQQRLGRIRGDSLGGQFAVGVLLGAVWSPCVGPTLGAAITLASQGRDLEQTALLMGLFGVGAAVPLAVLGAVSRASFSRFRGGAAAFGATARIVFGALFVVFGIAVLTGWDKTAEAALLDVSPLWLTRLTTSL